MVEITADKKRFIEGNILAPNTLPAKSWETTISARYTSSSASDISELSISINTAKPGIDKISISPDMVKRIGCSLNTEADFLVLLPKTNCTISAPDTA